MPFNSFGNGLATRVNSDWPVWADGGVPEWAGRHTYAEWVQGASALIAVPARRQFRGSGWALGSSWSQVMGRGATERLQCACAHETE